MRVLGIDPGLGRTGVAIVDGSVGNMTLEYSTCLETVPQTSESRRLANLHEMIVDLVKEYKPDVAAVETFFFSTNRSTAMAVAQARGAILCALGTTSLSTVEYSPNQVKEAVAGFGSARKPQVARMAANLLGRESIKGLDDETDACAIAICHHHRARLGRWINDATGASSGPLDAAVAKARARIAGGKQ